MSFSYHRMSISYHEDGLLSITGAISAKNLGNFCPFRFFLFALVNVSC
jgi:hypothetical protein